MTLKDKVIIVAGAASGIGRACTEMLCSQGALVYAADRQQTTLEECCTSTGAFPMATDISVSAACDELVTAVVYAQGRLHGMVNFAGVLKRTGILDCTDDEFDFVIDVNVKGCFYLRRASARVMQAQGFGLIVNVSSIRSDVGAAGVLAYGTAKWAVSQITRSGGRERSDQRSARNGPMALRKPCLPWYI